MHSFEVHSNKSACIKKVRLGLEEVFTRSLENPWVLCSVLVNTLATTGGSPCVGLLPVCEATAYCPVTASWVLLVGRFSSDSNISSPGAGISYKINRCKKV